MSIGQGALRMTLGYPSGPFTHGYRASIPRLSIDGVERAADWGVHTLALPAGPHTVKVVVHTEDGGTFGLAESPVTIALGGQAELIYRAPRFRGTRGKLRDERLREEPAAPARPVEPGGLPGETGP